MKKIVEAIKELQKIFSLHITLDVVLFVMFVEAMVLMHKY